MPHGIYDTLGSSYQIYAKHIKKWFLKTYYNGYKNGWGCEAHILLPHVHGFYNESEYHVSYEPPFTLANMVQ